MKACILNAAQMRPTLAAVAPFGLSGIGALGHPDELVSKRVHVGDNGQDGQGGAAVAGDSRCRRHRGFAMTALRLPSQLTVAAWEQHVTGPNGPFFGPGVWSRATLRDGLHLDFAAVEFAYFKALGRVLLVVDAAVRDGIPVTVALPTGAMSDSMDVPQAPSGWAVESSERRTARQARRRAEAEAFMRDVGFVEALHAPHWPVGAVVLSDARGTGGVTDDASPHGTKVSANSRPEGDQFRHRRILPFRWVHHLNGVGSGIEDALANCVRRLSDLGLSAADSRTVTHAIMAELVENVGRHASRGLRREPHALVAAVLVGESLFVSRRADGSAPTKVLIDSLGEDSGRQVLELLVGDSGGGMVSTLQPYDEKGAQKIIRNAFDRRPSDDERVRREANGLWRIARLVRSYCGIVKVSSVGATAGKSYTGPNATDFVESRTVVVPGTLVEITLVIERITAHEVSAAWSARSSSGEDARLEIVACDFDLVHGMGDSDRARLRTAARRAQDDQRVVGVVATIPVRRAGKQLTDGALEAALARALEAASHIPHPVSITVVFPDADPRILDLSVAGIDADEDPNPDSDYRALSPILVLGASGTPLWCGGFKRLRTILLALTAAGGALDWKSLSRHWAETGGDETTLRTTLEGYPHLVTSTPTEALLRVSAGNIVRALWASAHDQLSELVANGGPGVEIGYFRTPTLRQTNRWIQVKRVVDSTIGMDLVAWLLARKVEDNGNLPSWSESPITVARVASAGEYYATQLSECLSVGGRFYGMPGELDLDGIPVSEQVPKSASVVLCTDILSTENTARRAAAALASNQAVPVAVVCVIDSRLERGPIKIFNRDIPVLSLTTADVEGDPTPQNPVPVDIDPLLLSPVTGDHVATDNPPISEETLLEWCAKEVDWFRLGHVERMPRNRHFTAYLQFDRFLKDREINAKVREAVRSTIDDVTAQWRADDSRPTKWFESCEVWYPGAPADYAGALAKLVTSVVEEAGNEVTASRSIPRAVAGSRWTFPTSLDVEQRPRTVIVVDFGSLSATSIQQMMRLAAEAGASAIVALIFLNQLGEQDADALRAISAMRARRAEGLERAVPAEVRFLAATSFGTLGTQNCSLCETRDRAEDFAVTAPMALRSHAVHLLERTRVRTRREVFGSPAVDVFNVPILGTDVADYLRWRGLLQRALHVTAARQDVIDKLAVLVNQFGSTPGGTTWTRRNLLRLAAAEQHWLKLPPLRFAVARELLGWICVDVLGQPPTTSAWLRVQAVMVMAASDPHQLVRVLPELIVKTVDEPTMISHTLLECHRLLRKPLIDSPVDLDEMHMRLMRCRNRLEELRDDEESPAVGTYLRVLKQLITTLESRARSTPQNAQDAWHLLLEDFKRHVETHRMEAALLRVRDFVEDLLNAPPRAERSREALSDWDQCSQQLSDRALGNLYPLHEILAGDYVSDLLGLVAQRQVLKIALGQGVDELQDVSDRLHKLVELTWQPHDESWLQQRADLLTNLRWWHQMFVATHAEGEAAALLVQLVASIPTKPAVRVDKTLRAKVSDLAIRHSRLGSENRVFCPGPLLDEVLTHLIGNIAHHAIPGVKQRVDAKYSLSEGKLHIIVRNSGTRPRSRQGHGVRSLNEKLRPFGASLVGNPEADGEWTFTSTATFALWQGA